MKKSEVQKSEVQKSEPQRRKVQISKIIGRFAILLVAIVILLAPVPLRAQSCALCYTQAASSGSKMIQALKSGILILITPPTLGSLGLVFVVYRKRNQVRQPDEDTEPGNDW